jgi:hypothetical protein
VSKQERDSARVPHVSERYIRDTDSASSLSVYRTQRPVLRGRTPAPAGWPPALGSLTGGSDYPASPAEAPPLGRQLTHARGPPDLPQSGADSGPTTDRRQARHTPGAGSPRASHGDAPRPLAWRRASPFFAATSFSIALSSIASANSLFSRAFSSSSAFSRRASETSSPPYLASTCRTSHR